jgi:hypothetical protein
MARTKKDERKEEDDMSHGSSGFYCLLDAGFCGFLALVLESREVLADLSISWES